MRALEESRGDVPEREERDARFFAWDVPGDAHIVALVYEPDDAERSATVVDAIATSVARRREHTLLLSAEPGPSPLDELLGGTESEGLPAALGGRARLTDVAIQRPDRPFVYLPAGHDPEAMARLLTDHTLASFIGRVRERGGTLFMALTERTLGEASVRDALDGYVALGDAEVSAVAPSLEAYGRVRFDEDDAAPSANGDRDGPAKVEEADVDGGGAVAATPTEAAAPTRTEADDALSTEAEDALSSGAADAEGRPEDDAEAPEAATAAGGPTPLVATWGRHRARPAFPAAVVVGGLAAVFLLAIGWWWLAAATREGEGAETPASVARPGSDATSGMPPGGGPLDPAAARSAFEAAPELPFSVQIASFADRRDAEERLARLGGGGSDEAGFYFLAPTPVRGVVYHRLFAGALATRQEAEALLERLTAEGVAEDAGVWALKMTRLAFDLGAYGDRVAARARIAELADRGVPAYALEAPLDEGRAYLVYGGAYDSERASLPMAEILDEAGEPASLIARRGLAPGSPTP